MFYCIMCWRRRFLVVFLYSYVYFKCGTARSSVHVSHSNFQLPLVHVGDSAERSLIYQLFSSSSSRKRRTSRLLSFLQQRHRMASHETLSETLPLVHQYLPKKRVSTFYGIINLGEGEDNSFRVMFDTGSCEIWVPHYFCISTACLQRKRYHPTKTFKALPLKDQEIDVNYLSGNLRAYQAQETVSLDNFVTVKNQTVDFATVLDIPLLQDIQWDGILGLGFRNEDQKRRGTFPFLDSIRNQNLLKKQGLRNQFAYYISSPEGSLTFGGADLTLTFDGQANFSWVSIDPSTSYWGVRVDQVTMYFSKPRHNQETTPSFVVYQGSSLPNVKKTSILDTGTYLIYAPHGQISETLNGIQQSLDEALSCDIAKKTLPFFDFTFKGINNNFITLTLSPDDYVLHQDNQCYMGIVEDDASQEDELGGWTFGHVFLKTFYTLFDADVPAVGFTRPKLKSSL